MIYPSLKLGLLRVINAQPTAGIVHGTWTKQNQGSELGGLALNLRLQPLVLLPPKCCQG